MPNKGTHNPSSLYFSNEDYETIIDIVETWIERNWESIISFNEKQKDTLINLFQNWINKKKIFDFGIELLQMKNYQNEVSDDDGFVAKCIHNIKTQIEEIFSDETVQRQMNSITSRNYNVKTYYNIEFMKWRFSFNTPQNIFNEDIPWFSKSVTDNNKLWLFPNNNIKELLCSEAEEWRFLEDYICKVNVAYEDVKKEIDVFTRFTTSSWIHWIPAIIDWREFYLATALYQNIYSQIKEIQSWLEWSHAEWSQWNMNPTSYNFNLWDKSIEDLIDIREETFIDWLITQIKQAYLIWDEDMIKELKKSLSTMGKERRWKGLVGDLYRLCIMYRKLKMCMNIMKLNYWNNPYYNVVIWDRWVEETQKVDDVLMQDMLWFFRHKKFIARREYWNWIAKKAFNLHRLETEFYNYLMELKVSD